MASSYFSIYSVVKLLGSFGSNVKKTWQSTLADDFVAEQLAQKHLVEDF